MPASSSILAFVVKVRYLLMLSSPAQTNAVLAACSEGATDVGLLCFKPPSLKWFCHSFDRSPLLSLLCHLTPDFPTPWENAGVETFSGS